MDNSSLTLGTDPRKKPNFFQRFMFFMTLRQSGNNLLTNGAKGYLIAMSVIVILVAVAEGVAWGYFGTAFIPANPMVSGLIIGVFVFLLIWFFDRMLLTSDFMEHEHRLRLNGGVETQADIAKAKKSSVFLTGFFIARLVIALASLWIAAPYVTQLVFNADIQNKQQEYFHQAVLEVKQKYQDTQQAELQKLSEKIEQKNNEYQKEIAGGVGSLSGYKGVGVTAKAIGAELTDLKQQYQQLDQETKQRLKQIELALKNRDYAELAALDIRVDKDSPILRRKAIKDIELQYPQEFAQVEHTVQGLLLILAIILLGMKLMQFTTVKLYFSSNLQSKWNQYCLGKYDKYLPETDQRHVLLNSHEALPEEFERMMIELHQRKAEMEVEEKRIKEEEEARAEAKAAEEKRIKEEEEARKKAEEEERKRKEREEEDAKNAYFTRIAREKAEIEHRERYKEMVEKEVESVLALLKEEEVQYLQNDGAEIPRLQQEETEKIDELHEKEKQFKTQEERIDAKNQRIEQTESDIEKIEQKIEILSRGENAHSVETLEVIDRYSQALIRHQEILRGQRAELLGFQSNQKFYEESSQLLRNRLKDIQQQLSELQQPLRAIQKARSDVHTRKIGLLSKQGLEDAPIEKPSEQEWGFLADKIRGQLTETLPIPDSIK
ncbi:MAG: DUF4407 domain-containing protein [Acinetobacter sp.]|nr:MAG: DUF4407 domain-containing protein [Acinetobacter sp.]